MATKIETSIVPTVKAALEAGFKAYTRKDEGPAAIGFVYVCLDEAGSFAIIERPCNSWEPTSLAAPIKPSRDYGSAVVVYYDSTVEGAVKALRAACESPTVTVRFVAKRGQAAPVVPNYGRAAIDRCHGGVEEVTLATLEGQA